MEICLTIGDSEDTLRIKGKVVGKVAAVDEIKIIPAVQSPGSIGSWYAADVVKGEDNIQDVNAKAVGPAYRNEIREKLTHANTRGKSLKRILTT